MSNGTPKHAQAARQMAANGMSQRAIADALGISPATVNRLLKTDPAPDENPVVTLMRRVAEDRARQFPE